MMLTFLRSVPESDDSVSFYFGRVADFQFLPGQYCYLMLDAPNDVRGGIRQFTISSAPAEPFLRISVRMSASAFKQALSRLNPGDAVRLEGPHGTFYLNGSAHGEHVFIAQGIGITPFVSMARAFAGSTLPIQLTVLHTDSAENKIPLADEMRDFGQRLGFAYHKVICNTSGLTQAVHKHVDIKPTTTYWLSGPPKAVDTIETLLLSRGIDDLHIRIDKFTGY